MVYNIAHDIETMNSDGTYETISFSGAMPKSRELRLYNRYED